MINKKYLTAQLQANHRMVVQSLKKTNTMTFKKFYIVVTATQRWGRSIESLQKAQEIAYVKNPKKDHHVIYIGVVKEEATDAQLENLGKCFNVSEWGSVRLYDNPSEEDSKMIEDYFLGWIEEEMAKPKLKTKTTK